MVKILYFTALSMALLQINDAQAIASREGNVETALAAKPMAYFDGSTALTTGGASLAGNVGRERKGSGSALFDDGLELVSRRDQIVSRWTRPGYYDCYNSPYNQHCYWEPPRRVEEHRVTSQYRIEDRQQYEAHKSAVDGLLGALASGLFGGLAGLLAGILGLVFFGVAGVVIGGLVGSYLGRESAKAKPDTFAVVRHYQNEYLA